MESYSNTRFAAAAIGESNPLQSVLFDIAGGDAHALTDFYQQTVAFVFAISRSILKRKEDAEEVVCDVFMAVWQNAGHYDCDRGSVLAWLATLTRNRSIDRLRNHKSRQMADMSEPAGVEHDTPEDMLRLFQEGSRVHDALAGLSPVCRRLIALAFFEDLSHQEMATRLSMPLGTVKSRIRRSLAALKADLHVTQS